MPGRCDMGIEHRLLEAKETRMRLRTLPIITLALGAISVMAAGASAADFTRYEVTVLFTEDPVSTVCPCFFPQDISDSGLVAGFFFGTDGTYNAFRQEGPEVVDISVPGDNRSFARAINRSGHTVGWTNGWGIQHAFLYDGQQLINLGTLGGTYSDAHDINDAGDIVGSANLPDDDDHAVLWRNGQAIDLGTLGGPFSEARAINETGLIVGWSWNADWDSKPVYWSEDGSGPFEMALIAGNLGSASATDVNESGEIIGGVSVFGDGGSPVAHGLYWADRTAQPAELQLLPEAGEGISLYGGASLVSSTPAAIHDDGTIVGTTFPPQVEPFTRHGPFIIRDGAIRNLNDLLILDDTDWVIIDVAGISADGVIGATARLNGDGDATAVRLVPVTTELADLDGSGAVNVLDLIELLSSWGDCGTMCPADIDGNNAVDIFDLLALLGAWSA